MGGPGQNKNPLQQTGAAAGGNLGNAQMLIPGLSNPISQFIAQLPPGLIALLRGQPNAMATATPGPTGTAAGASITPAAAINPATTAPASAATGSLNPAAVNPAAATVQMSPVLAALNQLFGGGALDRGGAGETGGTGAGTGGAAGGAAGGVAGAGAAGGNDTEANAGWGGDFGGRASA